MLLDGANYKPEPNRQAVKQLCKRCNSFLGNRELLLLTKSNPLVQDNAQDPVGRFEFGSGGTEKLVHLIRKPSKPVFTHGASTLAGALGAQLPHGPPSESRYHIIVQGAGCTCSPRRNLSCVVGSASLPADEPAAILRYYFA